MEGKICSKCGKWKEYSEFHKKRNSYDSRCKMCKKDYDRQHRRENNEEYKKYQERYREENKEKLKEYRVKNKEKLDNYNKKHYKYNKEHKEKYRKENKEKIKQWRSNNKERLSKNNQKYRLTEKGKEMKYRSNMKRRSHNNKVIFESHERIEILDRDNWKCRKCGIWVHDAGIGLKNQRHLWDNEHKAHIDHIIPISKGGNSEPSNLQVLCRTCNLKKNDHIEMVVL